jgi:hypothetical protein
VADIDLNAERVLEFQDALTEAVRSSEEGVQRFVEPASGTLRMALSRRPHLIFGRRGSGKTSLLRKAIAEHNLDRRPSAFVDLEPFKGNTYPDVLISVLIEFFRSLKLWLDEAAVAPANKAGVWKRWFSKPRKKPLVRVTAEGISADVERVLVDLEVVLYAQDDAEIELRSEVSEKESAEMKASITAPQVGSLTAGMSTEQGRTEQMLERLRRSKANYLHRKILEYQRLLKRVVELADSDGVLILDDLYYIRRSDQPLVVDYFHRLTKNQRMWLKVGTIRHRSSWYVPGNDQGDLTAEFERIRTFCLSEKNVNCFLVEKDQATSGYRQIQELVDLRLLHLVKSRVTVRDRPGKTFEAYLLDFSQYTGERKKRDIKIVEFWKTGAEDELRRARLIYEPSNAIGAPAG